MAQMIREYHFSREEAWDQLPLAQAFAYQAAAGLANPFAHIKISGDGYIAQERNRGESA